MNRVTVLVVGAVLFFVAGFFMVIMQVPGGFIMIPIALIFGIWATVLARRKRL